MKRRDDDSDDLEDFEVEGAELDEEEDGAELQVEATVLCPYCGESAEITLDPGGGATQEYVEDCPVCCRPWQVHVGYSEEGKAEVWLEETG